MSQLRFALGVFSLVLLIHQPLVRAQEALDPTQVLLQVSKAFAGNRTMKSATLTGQVHRIAGSLDENGTITLIAHADGSLTANWSLNSGSLSEIRTAGSGGNASCAWTGSDGVQHPTPRHNCAVPATWFLPAMTVLGGVEIGAGLFTIPHSPESGELILHWSATPTVSNPESPVAKLALGDFDIAIDTASMLPSSLGYPLHPDLNAGIDIPVKVTYSDYRDINGVAVPFHIQRFLNGVLSVDIVVTDALAN